MLIEELFEGVRNHLAVPLPIDLSCHGSSVLPPARPHPFPEQVTLPPGGGLQSSYKVSVFGGGGGKQLGACLSKNNNRIIIASIFNIEALYNNYSV